MRRKTNRLLLLLISTALAACSSQSERGSSGLEVESTAGTPAEPTYQAPVPAPEPIAAEPAYEPERSGVNYIDTPLPEAPATVAPAEEFPVTTYELPPAPEAPQEVTVEDLGPIGDTGESVNYAAAPTPDVGTGVGAPTVYPEEEEMPVEDLGPIATEGQELSYAPEATPEVGTGVSTPQYPVEEVQAPVAITVTLDTQPLFNFDKYNIRNDQRNKLEQFVAGLKGTEYETILAVGHTDRIGTVAYNQKLSDRRADAVKAYLVRLGIPANKVRTIGRSKYNPVTSEDQCKGMRRKELIACYQPDRRVEVSVSGQKTAKAE